VLQQVFFEKTFQLRNLMEETHISYLDLQLKRTLYKLTEHHLETTELITECQCKFTKHKFSILSLSRSCNKQVEMMYTLMN
jgi:hypothetical protein